MESISEEISNEKVYGSVPCNKYFMRNEVSITSLRENAFSSLPPLYYTRVNQKKDIKQENRFHWQEIIIPLKYHKGRLLINSTYNLLHPCFSADGLAPIPALKNPLAKRCSICPLNGHFAHHQKPSRCFFIHSLLAFVPVSGELFSFSVIEPVAHDLELFLAAVTISGEKLYRYKVELQMDCVSNNSINLTRIKFNQVKKCSKKYVDQVITSICQKWQPPWLIEVLNKSTVIPYKQP
jgi:hypothetical protein